MAATGPDHYATLGLDRQCTGAQIRTAYRLLAKQLHPDVNGGAPAAAARMQAINAAHEALSDPDRRRDYDRELAARTRPASRTGKAMMNLATDVHLRIEELLRGTRLEVSVNDPGQPDGPERFDLEVPAGTAPGTRFRLPRRQGGVVTARVKVRPDFRFKVRGADLRCDLRISLSRARAGGLESVRGVTGQFVRVQIPPNVARGEVIRVPDEGLPRPRGGRGELLVRVLYTPDVQIRRLARP